MNSDLRFSIPSLFCQASSLLALLVVPAWGGEVLSIDPGHSAVIFSWDHRGFSHPVARFEQISGKVILDRKDLTKSTVSVTLAVAGIRTGSEALDRRLKGAEFLDAATYPIITFNSTKITSSGPESMTMNGDLSVHGTTRPVTLDVKVNKISPASELTTAGFDAEVMLRRSDFGVGRYVPMTGDDLTVHITLEAGHE